MPEDPLARPPKFIDETEIHMAELMTPDLENFSGKVHGGAILAILDKVAYVCACGYAATDCVTVSVEQVEFREPVCVGELLHFAARIVQVGRSSMDVEILVESQNLQRGSRRHTNTCYFTMVAMKDGKSVPVPPLQPRTPQDESRFVQARLRREARDAFRRRSQELLAQQAAVAQGDGDTG